jgi:hypothetical protein
MTVYSAFVRRLATGVVTRVQLGLQYFAVCAGSLLNKKCSLSVVIVLLG